MVAIRQVLPYVVLFIISTNATKIDTTPKEELVESESKDGTLEIIKQIKKVNEDGSYTVGYEADDGSFKIESRDVLGNIRGTYGYIDEDGKIKRVSYSTSNNTGELISKIDEPTVVQRIPKTNRTLSSPTKRPSTYSSTQGTTESSVIQSIAKRRSSTTTTEKPNLNEDSDAKTTTKPLHYVYATTPSRLLLRTTSSTSHSRKSEGQIIRPELITVRPTTLPLFKRIALNHPTNQKIKEKPVDEESEEKGNILRRQLNQEKVNYDPQEHLFTLQQSMGDDATDVYSASLTTGTPRPLFTTTSGSRARILSSTTPIPIAVPRPTRYQTNYETTPKDGTSTTTTEYHQDSTTTEHSLEPSTPTAIPIVQIPANRPTPEPFVAIRHPFQQGTVLVPLSHLQGRLIPADVAREINDNIQAQFLPQQQYIKETTPVPTNVPEIEPRPVFVRRLPPPHFRPMPVHVDDNGYVRELPQHQTTQNPYSIPVPVPVLPRYIDDVDNGIEDIAPPVSTRDFQKLLHQLIIRQSRLERISELTDPRRNPDFFRYRPPPPPYPAQYYNQRVPSNDKGPSQFSPEIAQQHRQYVLAAQERQYRNRQQNLYDVERYNNEATYSPTKRAARLNKATVSNNIQENEEYLPPDVREMLLLRMLQLAINPALPVDDIDSEEAETTTPTTRVKKMPVRNVEILGEEPEEPKPAERNKRYKQLGVNFYEKLM